MDRHTFVLSRSRLERLFRLIARRAGLGQPLGNCRVNGYDVDFYWPAGSFAAVEPLGQPWPP